MMIQQIQMYHEYLRQNNSKTKSSWNFLVKIQKDEISGDLSHTFYKKNVLLKVSQNSHENTCARDSLMLQIWSLELPVTAYFFLSFFSVYFALFKKFIYFIYEIIYLRNNTLSTNDYFIYEIIWRITAKKRTIQYKTWKKCLKCKIYLLEKKANSGACTFSFVSYTYQLKEKDTCYISCWYASSLSSFVKIKSRF